LGLNEVAGAVAAAAGVVGVPDPAGVPLVGVVAMLDFSLVETENPNCVEAAAW
jgi:hypothetical protein